MNTAIERSDSNSVRSIPTCFEPSCMQTRTARPAYERSKAISIRVSCEPDMRPFGRLDAPRSSGKRVDRSHRAYGE